jgi:hypothetical protein
MPSAGIYLSNETSMRRARARVAAFCMKEETMNRFRILTVAFVLMVSVALISGSAVSQPKTLKDQIIGHSCHR